MSDSTNIPYESPLHASILAALMARVSMSERDMGKYHSKWDEADKAFVAEIPERDVDAIRRTKRDAGKPQYTTINVPYAYGLMMTAHTFLCSIFLSRNPVLQWQGRHGEGEMQTQAVEALMDYNTNVGGHMFPYYVRNHDALKYGVSVMGTYWCKEEYTVADRVETPKMFGDVELPGQTQITKVTKVIPGYEGNKIFPVRPKDYLPDTRVPLIETQKGEFAGRKFEMTWNEIVKGKLSGRYINIDKARDTLRASGTRDRDPSGSSRLQIPGAETSGALHPDTSLINTLPGIELVVELIPNEWKLGVSQAPEKWIFTVIDRKVIIEARPFGMWHNQFPFNVTETEIEGYSLVKRGFMEIAKPMSDIITWLFNSHFFAVRKATNGDVVYDPSQIYESDLLNSDGTGSRIRIRPEAYGKDVRAAISVLSGGADVTGRHLQDVSVVAELMQQVLGITDNVMGAVNPGGRKTATEIRTTANGSINRMKTIAEFMSATGYSPLSQQMLQTAQQMYTGDKKFRIAGDNIYRPEKFIQVTPEDIAGFYDYIPVDGTLPIDRFASVNMWANLMQQAQRMPQLMQGYDWVQIFDWVGQLAGLKNIKQFKINVLPPGVQPGAGMELGGPNVAGGGAAPGPRYAGGTAAGGGNAGPVIPLPAQIAGVGRAG